MSKTKIKIVDGLADWFDQMENILDKAKVMLLEFSAREAIELAGVSAPEATYIIRMVAANQLLKAEESFWQQSILTKEDLINLKYLIVAGNVLEQYWLLDNRHLLDLAGEYAIQKLAEQKQPWGLKS